MNTRGSRNDGLFVVPATWQAAFRGGAHPAGAGNGLRRTGALKFLCWSLLGCCVFAAAADGRLRISDATGSESGAVGVLAFRLADERQPMKVSFHRLEAGAALDKLAAGETDVVLINAAEIPADFSGIRQVYAHDATVACVNAENPLRQVTRDQLKQMLTAVRPRWSLVGGSDADIHRYAVGRRDGRIAGAEKLNIFMTAAEILRLSSFAEAVLLTETDPAALAFGSGLPELPLRVVALQVDGVAPSRNTIRSGEYPLAVAYAAATSKSPPPEALALLESLASAEAGKLLEADGLLPPAAVSPGPESRGGRQ